MVAMRADKPRELSEDELDMVIEDSFPASDPPSHTPISGLGAVTEEEPGSRFGKKFMAMAAGGLVALAAVAALVMKMKSKSSSAEAEPA